MRTFWFLVGNKEVGSARLQGYNIIHLLNKEEKSAELIYNSFRYSEYLPKLPLIKTLIYQQFKKGDIIVVQKLNVGGTRELVLCAKRKGAKVVFIDCDLPIKMNIASEADVVITSSDLLKREYVKAGIKSVKVIKEYPEKDIYYKIVPGQKKFSACWFGQMSEERKEEIRWFKEVIDSKKLRSKWTFDVISNKEPFDYCWNQVDPYNLIAKYDVVVIPILETGGKNRTKSVNRVIQAMSLGVPVLASPIYSYKKLVSEGAPVLLCEGKNNWIETLINIENNTFRHKLKRQCKKWVNANYSEGNQLKAWYKILMEVAENNKSNNAGVNFYKRANKLRRYINCTSAITSSCRQERIYHKAVALKSTDSLISKKVILIIIYFGSLLASLYRKTNLSLKK